MAYLSDRQAEFERRLAAAATELGTTLERFAAAIVGQGLAAAQWDVLADHLAVGETYFFREMRTLALLESHVLPELARRADAEGRGLRIWSAGCCTGEEPYTLAIMLHRAGLWKGARGGARKGRGAQLLATDLNPRFLDKAREGGYRPWSFRGAPDWLLDYFVEEPGGLRRIAPEIRAMVRFEQLNLAHPAWPRDVFRELDLVLCRNVMLYFTKDGMREVALRFADRLAPGGWLVTAPAEAAHMLDLEVLEPVRLESALLFRRGEPDAGRCWLQPPLPTEAVVTMDVFLPTEAPSPHAVLEPELQAEAPPPPSPDAPALATSRPEDELASAIAALDAEPVASQGWSARAAALAQRLADAGRLEEARRWVERALAVTALDPALHHLQGVVAAAAGVPLEARAAWRKALYLDPALLTTRYLLLCLERDAGNAAAVATHGRVLLEQLQPLPSDDPAPGADGLSAGRLRELVEQVLFME